MEVKFLIADETYVKEIVKLCNEIFEENTSAEKALEIFKNTKEDKNQIYLIGIMDDKVIAHTKITIIPTIFEDMSTYAILNHVCVDPEYRKHGIATQMLSKVEEICKDRGCISMKLWSNNFRVPAHSCYKKFGFIINDAAFFSKGI